MAQVRATAPVPGGAEAFFSIYEQCLDPMLPVRRVIELIGEEVRRGDSLSAAWQREESRINVYLLLAAASCAADDCLAWRPWSLAPVERRYRRARLATGVAEPVLNLPHLAKRGPGARAIIAWRASLNSLLDRICDLLAGPADAPLPPELRRVLEALAANAPAALLDWHIAVPEAFRCQDLAHHDVIALARRFLAIHGRTRQRWAVVGPRTAGAYFAPLVSACLRRAGVPLAGWMTIRPKRGLTGEEGARLRELLSGGGRVLVVDDHPNSGRTLELTVALLERHGVRPADIVVMAPEHPAQTDWRSRLRAVSVVSLEPSEFHRYAFLHDDAQVLPVLREFYTARGWESVELEQSGEAGQASRRLAAHYGDGFQVRLKRVLAVRLRAAGRAEVRKYVFGKGVGWGWLAYHAYIAGTRLAGFVPPVLGLRNGVLFTEWVGTAPGVPTPPPETEAILSAAPGYLAARVARLPLPADCDGSGARSNAGDMLLRLLRRPYGLAVGSLKTRAIEQALRAELASRPILVDGRMRAEEWIAEGGRLYKSDFGQHNFGGGEADVMDVAHDLAGTIFELGLSPEQESRLLREYVELSGDKGVGDRVPLYKVLWGTLAMRAALYHLGRKSTADPEGCNRRYRAAQDFLTFHIARYSAARLEAPAPAEWTRRLFFLDLDGVFDGEYLGFPHPGPSALVALDLLRAHGYSVVLNTGRSVAHVREYCRIYGFQGGVAEYGSVFVDAVRQREIVLADEMAREQICRAREALRSLPGLFLDPGYEWALRAYRYSETGMVGPSRAEIEDCLRAHGLDRLRLLHGGSNSYLIAAAVNKGTGLAAALEYLRDYERPVAAMGDSAPDLEMLRQADLAYLPSNASRELRKLERERKCHIMRQPRQRGLLAAVRRLLAGHGDVYPPPSPGGSGAPANALLDSVLLASELPRWRQLMM